MRVIFRTDASTRIGSGHVMRCLALANQLRVNGAECIFICREQKGSLQEKILRNGFNVERLPYDANKIHYVNLAFSGKPDYSAWLGSDWRTDAEQTKLRIGDLKADWLIVDHYAIDVHWERKLRSVCRKLMVIDDLSNREHDCDVLLDQNYFTGMKNRYIKKVSESCKLLLGPSYALLRDEFREKRAHVKQRRGPVKRILVSFGGADAESFTTKVLQLLAEINLQLQVDVVVGSQHPCLNQIMTICNLNGYGYHLDINYISKLMLNADIAIGAGGSSSLERCCLGLPTLVFSLADNQIEIAKNLESFGACIYVGNAVDKNLMILKKKLTHLLSNPDEISVLSKNAYSLVDGLGTMRVYEELSTYLKKT